MRPAGPELSALVLAGGEARRMGGSKSGCSVGGRTLLERSLELAGRVSDDVMLAPGRRPLPERLAERCRLVADWSWASGPLGGLGAGLEAARHEWCLLLPCDMPFASEAVVARLAALAARAAGDAVAVADEFGVQPFQALYRRRAAGAVEACARSGRRSLRGLLERLDVTIVPLRDLADLDPELRFLCNVNTPADLDEARRLEEMVT